MEFNKEEFFKNDPLKIVRFIYLDLFQYKAVRILTILSFIIHLVLLVIQAHLFISTFEAMYFITYAPVFFGTFYVLLSLYGTLIYGDFILDLFEFSKPQLITKAHGPIYKKFKRDSNIVTYFVVFNTIVAGFCTLLLLNPADSEKEVFYAFAIFHNYFPKYIKIMSIVYRSTFLILSLTMPLPIYIFIYGTLHITSQIYFLYQDMDDLNIGYGNEDSEELFYNQQYQKYIRAKIIELHKSHVHLLLIAVGTRNRFRVHIMLYAIVGGVLGVSFLFFAFLFKGFLSMSILCRFGTMVVAGVGAFVASIQTGQNIEDQVSQAHDVLLAKSNWYNWNNENKKIFLTMIINTTKTFKMEFSENYSIDYKIGVTIARAVFSTYSVLWQLRKNTNAATWTFDF